MGFDGSVRLKLLEAAAEELVALQKENELLRGGAQLGPIVGAEVIRKQEVELAALRRVAEAARAFSIGPTIEQKTIVDGKTFVSLEVSEVERLADAFAEYDKCRAA